jgi:hypothetical protein
MKQDEREWMEYENITKEVILASGLDERIFYDLRGNHDSFGVPMQGAINDFYEKYSVNSRLRRNGNVQSVTLKVSIYVYFARIALYMTCEPQFQQNIILEPYLSYLVD